LRKAVLAGSFFQPWISPKLGGFEGKPLCLIRSRLREVVMPARPIWRGHLRLALVSCPVALWNAEHERNTIRFNQIIPKTGHRIRMMSVDAETDEEVQKRDLVKGFEFRKDQYLLLIDADLDSVKVESSSVISIEKFIEAGSIDPICGN
jgi:DNA end-binding protein Ku